MKALAVQYLISWPHANRMMKALSTKKNVAAGFFFELIDWGVQSNNKMTKAQEKIYYSDNYKPNTPLVHLKVWREIGEKV